MTVQINSTDYGVSSTMAMSLQRFVNHGLHPGDFLSLVIQGDTEKCLRYADPTRKQNLSKIIEMVREEVPDKFRGSEESFTNCLSEGGIT